MRAAPAMAPSLDDALRALETAGINFPDYRTVARFLHQLDDVRRGPAVLLDPEQAAALEGAYLAGFRCADDAGLLLAVSLPALLAYVGHGAPSSRLSWRGKLAAWRSFAVLTWSLALAALAAAVLDRDLQATGWLLMGASAAALVESKRRPPAASACTQNCNQGRACTCQGVLAFDSEELDQWKARALAAEKKIRDEQFARLFEAPNGGKYAG